MSMGGIVITYGPLSPLSVPGDVGWYYAGLDGKPWFNSTIGNNNPISQWNDQSGGAHDGNASAGNGPTYQTNIQNGLGSLLYNGTTQYIQINPIGFLQNLSGLTLMLVARSLNITGSKTILTMGVSGNSFYDNLGIGYNGTNYTVFAGGTFGGTPAIGTSTVAGDTTTFHIFTYIFDGTQTGNDNRLKFRFDQVQRTLTFTGTVPATTAAGLTDINLGSIEGKSKPTPSWNGYMGEFIIINRALSTSEALNLEQSLKNKWNTP